MQLGIGLQESHLAQRGDRTAKSVTCMKRAILESDTTLDLAERRVAGVIGELQVGYQLDAAVPWCQRIILRLLPCRARGVKR